MKALFISIFLTLLLVSSAMAADDKSMVGASQTMTRMFSQGNYSHVTTFGENVSLAELEEARSVFFKEFEMYRPWGEISVNRLQELILPMPRGIREPLNLALQAMRETLSVQAQPLPEMLSVPNAKIALVVPLERAVAERQSSFSR